MYPLFPKFSNNYLFFFAVFLRKGHSELYVYLICSYRLKAEERHCLRIRCWCRKYDGLF